MASTAQKLNFGTTDNKVGSDQARGHVHNVPKRLPVSVVDVDKTNSIITLKFETDGMPYTLPNVTMPLSGPEYIRYPIAKGDKGFVTSADTNIGNMSGLGPETPANFTLPANLSPLVFTPFGNSGWVKTDDQTAVVKYGPTGTVSRDTNKKAKHVVHPTSGVTTQTGAQGQTGPTSDPTYNITHAVHPTDGIKASTKDNQNGDHFSSIVPQGGSGILGILLSAFGGKHKHQIDGSGHQLTSSSGVNVTAPTTNIQSQTNITGDTNITGKANVTGNTNVGGLLSAAGGLLGGGGGFGGGAPSGGISSTGGVTGTSVASSGPVTAPSAAITGDITCNNLTGSGIISGPILQQSSALTVASLNASFPPATSFGMRSFVTDSTVIGFHAILVGGGTNAIQCFCDGANWRVG